MGKTIEQYFKDWEGATFGYNYGTGEEHIIPALKTFMSLCPAEGCYDYVELEAALTPCIAWLFINILCRVDILEYGTSPRGAWLTKSGMALKKFIDSRTVDELFGIIDYNKDYVACYPDFCNCGSGGKCDNPFWENE